MRRPASASKTLGCSPLLKASWAHAARVEAVPIEATGAEPVVFFPRRPAAQRASDARPGCITALIEGGLAVDYGSRGHIY